MYWSLDTSSYIISKEGGKRKINFFNLLAITLRATNGVLVNFLYFSTVYYAVLAGINFSIIITIFAFTPFFTALAFYLLFNE